MPLVHIDLDETIPGPAGVRRDDIFATLTENTAEDWYAGVDAAAQP
jgi:hypothetical protein